MQNWKRFAALSLTAVLLCSALPSSAINFHVDYDFDEGGFFSNPEARAALERALDFFRDFDDPLGYVPSGTHISLNYPDTGERIYAVTDDDFGPHGMVILVGARPQAHEGRLAYGQPSTTIAPCVDLFGEHDCLKAVRGELPDPSIIRDWIFTHIFRSAPGARKYPPSAFTPMVGTLSFASDVDWYFGESDQVPEDRYDFLSVAIHEIGHILGVGTSESWSVRVSHSHFHGEEATAEHGGGIPLASDFAHWADGTMSDVDGDPSRPAFSQHLAKGERRLLTTLDRLALRDVGWKRAPIADNEGLEFAYVDAWIKGDVNGDGLVNKHDANLVQRHLVRRSLDVNLIDVAPFPDGVPIGDGAFDEDDRQLLKVAASLREEPVEDVLWILAWSSENDPAMHDTFRAAFAIQGWRLPDDPENPTPGEIFLGTPVNGDVNHDGVLDGTDIGLIDLPVLTDARALAAADVVPFDGHGNSVGDGIVDTKDLALLRSIDFLSDTDGDGLLDEVENGLNSIWMQWAGRPRFHPLTRWSEQCLTLGPVTPDQFGNYFGRHGVLSLQHCSRNGTPWALSAAEAKPERDSVTMPRKSDARSFELENAIDPKANSSSRQAANDIVLTIDEGPKAVRPKLITIRSADAEAIRSATQDRAQPRETQLHADIQPRAIPLEEEPQSQPSSSVSLSEETIHTPTERDWLESLFGALMDGLRAITEWLATALSRART